MAKKFNVTGICTPERNYMVDTSDRVETIVSEYVREGKYYTINRARQYGKTTLLYRLEERLKEDYLVRNPNITARGTSLLMETAFSRRKCMISSFQNWRCTVVFIGRLPWSAVSILLAASFRWSLS